MAASTASVKRCQPHAAWLFAAPRPTVRTVLSSRTPRSAHGVRSPPDGCGRPRSVCSSVKILRSDGGRRSPCGTENARPMACPGS